MTYKNALSFDGAMKKIAQRAETHALCFFGSGADCDKILDWFVKHDLRLPEGICDNDIKKQGTFKEGIPIISFDTALALYPQLSILITSSLYGDSIQQQVKEKVSEENILNTSPFFHDNSTYKKEVLQQYRISISGNDAPPFPLPPPEKKTDEVIDIITTLKKYEQAYLKGENLQLDPSSVWMESRIPNFWTYSLSHKPINHEIDLITFLNKPSYHDVYHVDGFRSHLYRSDSSLKLVNISQAVENVSSFSRFLSALSIPFLYVQLPEKFSPEAVTLPLAYENRANTASSEFVQGLDNKAVKTLDYRQCMITEKRDFSDSFFKSDPHWTSRTAFHATKRVCQDLEKLANHPFDWSKLDLMEYSSTIYKDILLGAFSQYSNLLYGGLDDFELILPKFDTDYTWELPLQGYIKRGPSAEALLYPAQLDSDFRHFNAYASYSLGSYPYTKITNHQQPHKGKILCIHDSFALPMATFLATQFSELYFYDLRESKSKLDLFQLIREKKPDMVTMMYTTFTYPFTPIMTNVNPNSK